MRGIFSGGGYLLADDRSSGGIVEEADIIGCNHCQKLMRKSAWQEDGGFCHSCAKPICGHCADVQVTSGCVPFIQRLDRAVDDHYRRQQNAKILGI